MHLENPTVRKRTAEAERSLEKKFVRFFVLLFSFLSFSFFFFNSFADVSVKVMTDTFGS